MSVDYGVKQIKTLEGIEAIRLRSGMYIGSTGPEGVAHITLEIISNVIDEYLVGSCTECQISVSENGEVQITDNGRGVPFGKAADGSETLVNIYTKLHTGAKFDSDGKTGYNTSGGMNGVGAKATNALSEYFIVESYRDGKMAKAEFKKGKLQKYNEAAAKGSKKGTTITFKPDAEIFKETIHLDYNKLRNQIRELAFLSPGLTFQFNWYGCETENIKSENGILDYVDHLTDKKKTLTSKFYAEKMEDRLGVKVSFAYVDNYSETYRLFTNSIPNSAGTHLTGFRTAFTSSFNQYLRKKGLLKDKDENFSSEDLKEGLVLVLSVIMPDPVFSGQTKDTLTSSEARTLVQRLCVNELENWFNTHEKDAKAIYDKAALARKARDSARKAKDAIRNTENKSKSKFINLPSKLVDAWSKKREKCELIICEGDSAASGLIAARNGEFQAIFPIRGKIISCFKNTPEKVFGNQEVSNIVKALGMDINKQTGKLIYDTSKLRYGSIVFACDADPDGASIKNLLFECFWWLCPELVINGHINVAVPPLFRITTKKNEYIYLKDQKALEEYKATHHDSYLVNRNKGLGEQSPDELAYCLLETATRNVQQITVNDSKQTENLLEILLGPSVPPRRDYILKHSEEANDI